MMFCGVLNFWIRLRDISCTEDMGLFDLVDGSSSDQPKRCTQFVCQLLKQLNGAVPLPHLNWAFRVNWIFHWVWWPECIYTCVHPGELIWSSIPSEDISKKGAKLTHTCTSVRLDVYHSDLVYLLHHQFLCLK